MVWASNPPEGPAQINLAETPVAATYAVPVSDQQDVETRLGVECEADLGALPVIVVSTGEEGTATAIVSAADCEPLRLTAADDRLTRAG